jgi:gamma-glutamylcyclotransferase (GGCT)/AIG2-like uncharacterized protein YtfP
MNVSHWYSQSAHASDYPADQQIMLFQFSSYDEDEKKRDRLVKREQMLKDMKKPGPKPGDRIQNQEVGRNFNTNIVLPEVYHPHAKEYCFLGGKPNEWMSANNPDMGETTIPVRRYTNYLSDKEYVSLVHDKLKGKVFQWRKYCLQYLKELRQQHLLPETALRTQLNFVKFDSLRILKGINHLKSVPIDIMSEEAILKYVPGVDDIEKAHFVHKMATCHKFTIAIVFHDSQNNVSIVTIFNDDSKHFYAYGKQHIECLNGMKPACVTNRRTDAPLAKEQDVIEIKESDEYHVVRVKPETKRGGLKTAESEV